jgi:hypothetical protein
MTAWVNPYRTLDTRPRWLREHEERLAWALRRTPQPYKPAPAGNDHDPWAKDITDPFAESAALHHPKDTRNLT